VKNILESVSNHQKVTKKLIVQLNEFQDSILPDIMHIRFVHGRIGYTPNFMSSNIGEWGSALYFDVGDNQRHPIPTTLSDCGVRKCFPGDVNTFYMYSTRHEVLAIAQGLPAFLNAWKDVCDKESAEGATASATLDIMLESIKDNIRYTLP